MKNILVLYNGQSLFTPTVREYLESFRKYSRHNVHYLHVGGETRLGCDLSPYDAVLITYSIRLCFLDNYSRDVLEAVARFQGLKVAFIQDEYQQTNRVRLALRALDVRLVFTCVPEDRIAWVYPPSTLPETRFVRVLTGYVPESLRTLDQGRLPGLQERPTWIGYRGRPMGHWWGDLAYFKEEIGKRFRSACIRADIPHDIAWTEEARIYQSGWYRFLGSCRATLGVPSGSNVFDWDGSLEQEYRNLVQLHGEIPYEEYRPRIAAREQEIDMGQISPRVFEAAAMGTVLVLLEGNYSGILSPGTDYIEVKRDFSNINDVLAQISNLPLMEQLRRNAFDRLIRSGAWTYQRFVEQVDHEMERAAGWENEGGPWWETFASRDKTFDQEFLETLGLASAVQVPMERCLDLSHLRDQKDERAVLAHAIKAVLPRIIKDPKATSPSISSPAIHTSWKHRIKSRMPGPLKRWLKRWVARMRPAAHDWVRDLRGRPAWSAESESGAKDSDASALQNAVFFRQTVARQCSGKDGQETACGPT